jgi:hypothetical protein
MTSRILICGSENFPNDTAIIPQVERAVARAIELDLSIITTDQFGVAEWVCRAAAAQSYRRVFCYGVGAQPRNKTPYLYLPSGIDAHGVFRFTDDWQRDRYMVSLSNIIYVIWNGQSPAEVALYNHAKVCGKQAHLVTV